MELNYFGLYLNEVIGFLSQILWKSRIGKDVMRTAHQKDMKLSAWRLHCTLYFILSLTPWQMDCIFEISFQESAKLYIIHSSISWDASKEAVAKMKHHNVLRIGSVLEMMRKLEKCLWLIIFSSSASRNTYTHTHKHVFIFAKEMLQQWEKLICFNLISIETTQERWWSVMNSGGYFDINIRLNGHIYLKLLMPYKHIYI